MKNLRTFIIIVLSLFVFSCEKDDKDSIVNNNNEEYQGGGTVDCNYPELSAENLPNLIWMLEGSQSDYQSYNKNGYFKFGSNWLSGSQYLCSGYRKYHNAWDIHRPNEAQIKGKKVYAAYPGLVKAVYNAGSGFAMGITIEHRDLSNNKFTTNYTHVDPITGLQGTNVTTGQLIGYVADLAQNDHLHFSIRRAPYSNISNRGALPRYLNDNNCECSGDPVFPEYFINPGLINYYSNNFQLPPNLTTPSNNSTNVSTPINFSWENLGGDAVYRIQVSKSLNDWSEEGFANNSNLVLDQNTNSTNSFTWSNSQNSTTYYWAVKTFKNGISSKYSQPYKFTTGNSNNNDTRIINLSGNLSYGNVNVGDYLDRTLTVTNSGNSTLSVSNVSVPNGFSVLNGQSFSIGAGQSQNLTIRFQPQNARTYSGDIIVTSNATSGTSTIYASGTGIQNNETRIINLSGNLSFGSVNVGDYLDRTLTVTNSGNSTLSVSNISVPNGFSVLNGQSFSLGAGESQNLTIRFQPQSATTYSGNITVTSNATGGTPTIYASGTGVENTQTRIINLSGNLSFGNVNVGDYLDRTLTVTNNGNSTLSVSNISVPNGFSVLNGQSFNLGAGQSRNLTIRFQPQSATTYSGNITVTSNATSGTPTIYASGTGINNTPSYSVTPNIGVYSSGTEGTLHGNCTDNPDFPVYPNVIKLTVTQITTSTIAFRMEKVSGTFQNNGNFYLKRNGICGANLIDPRPYQIGQYYLDNITIPNNLQPGQSLTLYGLIISNTTDRYYAGPIVITRNN